MIRPLCASITPYADESLISLIGRAAVVNEMTSLGKLLQLADIVALNPGFAALTQGSASGNIASLLGLDKSAIEQRMHPRIAELASPTVDWFGTPLERRFIEVKHRRYSPSGLLKAAYGRSLWMIRPLHYCPESLDLLRYRCPSCEKTLGWVRTRGLDCCEGCHATLDAASEALDPEFAGEAIQIANLLHQTRDVRERELMNLPEPFNRWEPGEVFAAVVDLGVIAANPLVPYNHPLGKQSAAGDFRALGGRGIFLGWQLVRGWPTSMAPIVESILSANAGKPSEYGASLGPLARHVGPAARPTKLRNLLRETMPLIYSLIAPSRLELGHLGKRSALGDALTTTETAKMLGVTLKTMRRLKHQGQRIATYAPAKNSVRLFDRQTVQNIVEFRAAAIGHQDAARRLGVPVHVIPYLCEEGLLTPVKSEEVMLLAGTQELVDRNSLAQLSKSVLSRSRSARSARTITLEDGLRHQLNPAVWVGIIKRMLSKDLLVSVGDASEPLAKAIHTDVTQLRGLNNILDVRPATDTCVRRSEARELIRVNHAVLSKAVAQGLVKTLGAGLSLWSLMDFRSRYVLPSEVDDKFFGRSRVFSNTMRAGGAKPAATFCKANLWERSDVVRIFAESGSAEFRLI